MNNQTRWFRILLATLAVLIILGLIIGFVWWVISRVTNREEKPMTEIITLETSDGVKIVGDLYRAADTPKGAILFLHMLPADRTSWQPLGSRLQTAGYTGLAIDLRGHGESLHQGEKILDYQTFSDAEHQQSQFDIQAALDYLLKETKLAPSQIGLVGASIGANLALVTLADQPQLGWGVLLSPGTSYRGIDIQEAVKHLAPPTRLLLLAGTDDTYSLEAVRLIAATTPTITTSKELVSGGHGTNLWNKQLFALDLIVNWVTTDRKE